MSSKLNEAQEHCRAAEKFLKTSLLRWKPDYDSAADEYSQAAQCYRIARDLNKSKECHLKASEYYKKNRSFFHAAKSLENAIIVTKETAPGEEIYTLALESSSLYQQYGSGDSGANVLDKAAKILEEKHPEKAVLLFQQAADVSSAESSQHAGAEYISKSSRILVRLQKYDQAVDSLRREIGFHQESGNTGAVGRLTVAVVLVQLARGDPVAAEKAYKEWGNNCEVPEMSTLEQLLQAYDEEDREGARRALANPFIRSMDVEYARLAASIPLPEGIEPAPKANVRENAAPSYVSANASNTAELASPFIRSMDVEYARLAASIPLPEDIEPAPKANVRENAAPSYVSASASNAVELDDAAAKDVRENAAPSIVSASASHAANYKEDDEFPYETVTYEVRKQDEEDGLC